MLSLVEIRTSRGTMLSLPIDDISDGIVLESIEGLDPVKATLVSSSLAQMDGTQYHSSRRESRNIKFTISLEPDYILNSVSDVRNRLYSYFIPKAFVGIRFYTSEGLVVDIFGRVESFETLLFAKEPKVDISVMCFDPDFVELDPIQILGDTVSDNTETLIEYSGTVETGIRLVLNVDRTLTEFTVYQRAPDDSIRSLDFSAALVAGDVVEINTVVANKRATLTRSNVLTSVLYGVSPQSNWIQLEQGDNNLRVYAVGAPIPHELYYTPRHGGL